MKRIEMILAAALVLAAVSCSEKEPIIINNRPSAERIYILNSGGYGANNASISVLDIRSGAINADIFADANGSPLGDTANDILVLEDRIVIAVNGSNIIQVCDINGKALASTESVPNVRKLAADEAGGFIYATSYADDGYVAKLRLDDCSLVAKAKVGFEPEGIVLHDGKLFVANTGGYAFLGGHAHEQTISIVDAATMTETGRIDTGLKNLYGSFIQNEENPEYILVNAAGDYVSSPAGSLVFDCRSCSIVEKFDFPATYAATYGDSFYTIGSEYDSATNGYSYRLNRITVGPDGVEVVPGLAPECPSEDDGVATAVRKMASPSGIFIDSDGSVYVADSGDYTGRGYVHRFKADGTFVGKYTVGVCPGVFARNR